MNSFVSKCQTICLCLLILGNIEFAVARTYVVNNQASSASDKNPGTFVLPLKSIRAVANLAYPGDTIFVKAGIYREEVVPPRGGTSAEKPIVYMAAPGEYVSIRGSEKIEGWVDQGDNVWMIELNNSFFGDYNPYDINLKGSWLAYGKEHHVGDVYLNGEAFYEKQSLGEVKSSKNTWHAKVGKSTTRIWANFGWANPNVNLAEINVHECVIFPDIQG